MNSNQLNYYRMLFLCCSNSKCINITVCDIIIIMFPSSSLYLCLICVSLFFRIVIVCHKMSLCLPTIKLKGCSIFVITILCSTRFNVNVNLH